MHAAHGGNHDPRTLEECCHDLVDTYHDVFGETALEERLEDLTKEVLEIRMATTTAKRHEEISDALGSLVNLIAEEGLDPIELIRANQAKIERRRLQYQGMGRKLSVVILGTAADPLTLAHVEAARFAVRAGRFDKAWIMPPVEHLLGKRMADYEHRLALAELAIEAVGDRTVEVSDYERRGQYRGATYRLVKGLLEDPEYQDRYRFTFAIGLDVALHLPHWPDSEHLRRTIPFVVLPRHGYTIDPENLWFTQPPHRFLAAREPIMECSSTDVRALLAAGDPAARRFLSEGQLRYIAAHRLYGFQGWEPAPTWSDRRVEPKTA